MMKNLIILLSLLFSLPACGQIGNHTHKSKTMIDFKVITNPVAKQAVEAFQAGDKKKWLSLFVEKPTLLDDGNPRDFKDFSENAVGHENFVTIDKVENDGKSVYGHFHSDQWGDFKAYFKFHFNDQQKIEKLEIGQAKY